MTIDREKHVTRPKNSIRWPGRDHRAHQHAAIAIFKSEKLSLRGILQFGIGDCEIGVFVIMAIANILQEPDDDRRGNHIGHPLSDIPAVTLKCNTDNFSILHHSTTTNARAELRADLDRLMLNNRPMRKNL